MQDVCYMRDMLTYQVKSINISDYKSSNILSEKLVLANLLALTLQNIDYDHLLSSSNPLRIPLTLAYCC